jgi:2,3-bisphosphoglycerate-independent phosphoglycerate mutase
MSAKAVTGSVIQAIESNAFDFIIVNFANCDMVGHTGDFDAAVAAVETVDACLGDILAAIEQAGGTAIVTADHGNCEEMIDLETGAVLTAHTTNPVFCVVIVPDAHPLRQATLRASGKLANVAPTVLQLMGIQPPAAMTEASLILS